MGAYGGPDIITDGLVFAVDAGSERSYPGSGTTTTSLVGSDTGTLTNGVGFSTDNGGTWDFDGTDDYVLFNASLGSATTVSVEMWCEIPSSYSGKMFMGWSGYDVWCWSGTLGYNTNNGDVYGISSATVSSLGLVNNWKHYIFEMRSDVSYTNNKIYINGVSQTLSQQNASEIAGNRNFNGGVGQFPGYQSSPTSYVMALKVGCFRLYNRALTTAEVLQNYNAQKNRFI